MDLTSWYDRRMKTVLHWLLCLGLVTCVTPVLANEYEELSYDDLVNQLQQKKRKVENATVRNSLDDLKLHAGVGLLTAINRIDVPGTTGERALSGFQISAGIDLFSPEWVSEFALKNFGRSEQGAETRSLREIDLRVFHRKVISGQLGYRLGGGLGTRYLQFSNQKVSISEQTPCFVAFSSLEAYVGPNVSLGAEAGVRAALVERTIDKSALDLMVRLDTFF